mgnify:CR=1 FL=1
MGLFLVYFLGYSLITERKAPDEKIRRLPERFRQAAQSFFAFSSDACHEAADLLHGFFFHACCHMGVDIQ